MRLTDLFLKGIRKRNHDRIYVADDSHECCMKCGFVNKIDESELYTSDDEYRADLRNPYKGLSDADALELSLYEDIEETIREKRSSCFTEMVRTALISVDRWRLFPRDIKYLHLIRADMVRHREEKHLLRSANLLMT